MASNPFFSARIPQNLHDHIEKWREETGESKTDVLINALAKYTSFDLSTETPAIPPIQEKLEEILRRLDILENKTITSDNRIKSKIKQLEITNDNSKITPNAVASDNRKITPDNKAQILSGKDAANLLGKGCSLTSLHRWRRQKELPKVKNGYKIEAEDEKKWKITKVDN